MACEKCNVVINELLAFINHKIDVLDEVSIIQICDTAYSEDEVEAARALLCECVPSRRPTRKREHRKKKSLQDIITILKETDPDDVPKFAACDLNKLPPVSFDHVDVTSFLKDLVIIKADIAQLKGSCGTPVATDSSLVAEVQQLKNAVEQLSCSTSLRASTSTRDPISSPMKSETLSSQNVTTPQCDSPVASTSSGLVCATQQVDRVIADAALSIEPRDNNVPAPTAPPPRPAAACARPKGQCTLKSGGVSAKRGKLPVGAVTSQLSETKDHLPPLRDKDGFTVVESRKKKRRRNKRGTATPNECVLKAAPRTVFVYVSRLRRDTKVEDVVRHVESKGERVENVEPLPSYWADTNFSAFKLHVPAEKVKSFLCRNFWPEGVVFRRYNNGRHREVATSRPELSPVPAVIATTTPIQAPPTMVTTPTQAPPATVVTPTPAPLPSRSVPPPVATRAVSRSMYPGYYWDPYKQKWRKDY